MEGLDAAVEHLGEAGEVADVLDGEAGFAQGAGGSAGGDELDAEAGEHLGKLHQAGFVGHAQQRAADRFCMLLFDVLTVRSLAIFVERIRRAKRGAGREDQTTDYIESPANLVPRFAPIETAFVVRNARKEMH